MFRVTQLFVFVFLFGRIVHRTIRIRPNSLKPLFGTSLVSNDTKHANQSRKTYNMCLPIY